jgi:hypothetical protein
MAGDKYYKAEKARQKKFREAEKEMDENYKKVRREESEFEYLNSLFPEDSTREYNPVEYYKEGGLVSRGQGRVIKSKKTKMY